MTVSDGYRLHFRQWDVPHPKGIVIAIHGIQSHSGWYEYSSGRMAESGFSVYFADRRGSGLSGRERGHAAHAMRLIHDVRSLTRLACSEHETRHGERPPVTVLGLSWGGKIAAATAALFPLEYDSVALLYPGLAPRIRLSVWQKFRLSLAREFEIVRRHIPIPINDPALFTKVSEWQQFIAEDPLVLQTVTSSFLNAGRELDRILKENAPRIQQPLLLMLAGKDAIIDNDGVRSRLNSIGSRSVTTLHYEDACHTLEFEPKREMIFSDLNRWLRDTAVVSPDQ
jgi:alpha-beta hydrolase superfamily lysophospholipase